MTSLPDWLVERAALDEVAPTNRDRIDRADPDELARRIAGVRDDNASELARHPAAPAVAEIEARVANSRRRVEQRRRLRLGMLGAAATCAVAVLVVSRVGADRTPGELPVVDPRPPVGSDEEITRVKGTARLLAFRQVGGGSGRDSGRIEKLEQDALVRAGDLIQLRYNAGGQGYGVIASVDGAGVVTLHYPIGEDAPPAATAVSAETTALPHAYALDDAPRFERFFFITANEPIDVQHSLAALRTFAQRTDCGTASIELPAGLRQASLRLRKPERPSNTNRSQTP